MPFEIVEAGNLNAHALQEGEASIDRRGSLVVRSADLEAVGITNYAIVLADADTRRIGLRAVRDGEQSISLACSVILTGSRNDSRRRRTSVLRAIRRLGLTPEAVAGRYTLNVHRDELLFITLDEVKDVPPVRQITPKAGGKTNK